MTNDLLTIIQNLDRGPTNPIPLYEISKYLTVKIDDDVLIAYLRKLEEQGKVQLIWFDDDLLTGVILP